MKKIYVLLAAAIVFAACKKTITDAAVANTPVQNFDELWKGYDGWYGLFSVKNIDWDSMYAVYRPQVKDSMSNEALYQVLSSLIDPLNDIHVFLQPTSDRLPRFESSEFFQTHKYQYEFSIDVVRRNYLPSLITVNNNLHYGILDGNIGYIHFGAFDMPVDFYQQQMDVIMHGLEGTKGLILDIRNHEGGDDEVSHYIAGWFAAQKALYMTVRKRSGSRHTDFTKPQYWYTDKQGDYQYTNPVKLLTTRWTASAGETFTWALNTQPQVTQMGDTTAGGFSDVSVRELPNGWLYFVSVGDYRNAKGESGEGKGVAPAVYIVNTKEEVDNGRDAVLELAIDSF